MHTRTAASLHDVLDEQIDCVRAIAGALGLEDEALRNGDLDGLNAASAEKARLVETLETLEQERRGLAEIESAAGLEAAADAKWRELLGLLAQCKERNQRNGVLVKARHQQVAAALRNLRGAESDSYDAKGRGRAAPNGHRLGSA